jgi:hypothetical protein
MKYGVILIRTSIFRKVGVVDVRLVPAERCGEAAAEKHGAEVLFVLRNGA